MSLVTMKKDLKIYLGLLGIVVLVVLGINFLKSSNGDEENLSELAKCIGEKATLYIQLGCSHCDAQEKLFGENYPYLKVIDCTVAEDRQKCIDAEISGTPTWIVNGEKYPGFKTLEELKEITECK